MPNRIPTPGVKTPAVRKSPIATPAATPKQYTPAEKPAHGSDGYAKKKYGSSAWNNGYTN